MTTECSQLPQCCICLRRSCHPRIVIREYGQRWACRLCVDRAVKLSHEMAMQFGGQYSDICGDKVAKAEGRA